MKRICKRLLCAIGCAAMLAADGTAGAVRVPVLMYHDVTTDAAKADSMTVTEEQLRLDMEFLQQFGYTAVLPAELTEMHLGLRPMPVRPVMITFDDGYLSGYTLAAPLLRQTGMRAAIAVISSSIRPTGDTSVPRSFMNWDELRTLVDEGLVEVGSHTHNLHNPPSGNYLDSGPNGLQRRRGETQSAYNTRVGGDLNASAVRIRQETGQQAVCYLAFPFGVYDAWAQPLLESAGFTVTTMTTEGVADTAKGLVRLPRVRITGQRPVPTVLRRTDMAAPAAVSVSVNDEQPHTLSAYNIGGANFVRVRDAAALLRDTGSGFDVNWDAARERVELTSFAHYTPRGTEGAALPAGIRSVQSAVAMTVVNSVPHYAAAYNIGGNTFYKLRGLGELCGFTVDWDAQTGTVYLFA